MISARLNLKRTGFELNADIEIDKGVTALYGHSGAGKTTILRLLAGLERGANADDIEIRDDGNTWHSNNAFLPAHKRGVAYVFQRPQLFPYLTVEKNLAYASKRAHSSNAPDPAQVGEWLDLEPLLAKRPHELSGGEAQRAAIGRALLSGAKYLLMDEPLGSIDQEARWRILPYLARLHHTLDVPMVYVSHSLDEVNYLADRVYVIERGRILGSGLVYDTSASIALNKSERGDPAAVLKGKPVKFDSQFELTEFTIGTQSLFLTTGPLADGEYRVRIPARDVSLTLTEPQDTSILNVLSVTIEEIEAGDGPTALIRLRADNQDFLARITRKSLASLNLSEGQSVFAQIKGVALLTDNVS